MNDWASMVCVNNPTYRSVLVKSGVANQQLIQGRQLTRRGH